MAERVEHWFNRRYHSGRRDVYLLRTETGWQVVGRRGGSDGQQATHYFDREDEPAPCCSACSTPHPLRSPTGRR
jgi:hypothetical protein